MNLLRTARLTLAPPTEGDHADLAALWSDAEALRHIGPPASPSDIWARLLKYVGHWALFGIGYRVIREADTGRFVGEVGLAYQRRAIAALGDDPEAGWSLAPWSHGRGYAAEALGAVLEELDRGPAPRRVTCMITPANLPSIRLAERHGFASFDAAVLNGTLLTLFERGPFSPPLAVNS